MRKILTILLTLVMAICLVNFSNNNIKAEEPNPVSSMDLVSGDDFRTKVLAFLSNHPDVDTISHIKFNDDNLPNDNYVDLSYTQNQSIRGYVNQNGDTFCITAGPGNKIKFNSNCHDMFATQTYETAAFKFAQIKSIDFGSSIIDTTAVTSMSHMFYGCYSLEEISNLDQFVTSAVINMEGMFASCRSLQSIDISSFNSAVLTNTKSMFANCWSLSKIDFPTTFTCANVTDMTRMFSTCLLLNTLDINNFDTSKVTDAEGMFQGCINLVRIYANSSTTYFGITSKSDKMFYNCLNLVGEKGTTIEDNPIDKQYARVDGNNGDPGYFTSSSLKQTGQIEYDENLKYFKVGSTPISTSKLSYDETTKMVTFNDFNIDIDNENLTIALPSQTEIINIQGQNSIVNTKGSEGEPIMDLENSVTFIGDGNLVLANVNYANVLNGTEVIINGPTINLIGNGYYDGDGEGSLLVKDFTMKSGTLNTSGIIGILLQAKFDNAEDKITFVYEGGTINAFGTYAGICEHTKQGTQVVPNAKVLGSDIYDTKLRNVKLGKLDIPTNKPEEPKLYTFYVGNDVIANRVQITKKDAPEPSPKDESCEKVIGPTWHWNNKKGICEDTGVVKTYTR